MTSIAWHVSAATPASGPAPDVKNFSLGGYHFGMRLSDVQPALEAKYGVQPADPHKQREGVQRTEFNCTTGQDYIVRPEIMNFNDEIDIKRFPNLAATYEKQRIDLSNVCIRTLAFGTSEAAVALTFRPVGSDAHDEVISAISFAQPLTEKPQFPGDVSGITKYMDAAIAHYGKPTVRDPHQNLAAWCTPGYSQQVCEDTVNGYFGAATSGIVAPKAHEFMKLTIGGTMSMSDLNGSTQVAKLVLVQLSQQDLKIDRGQQTKPAFGSDLGAGISPAGARASRALAGGSVAATGGSVAPAGLQFDVVNAWVDRSPTSYYFHDTLEIHGGNSGVTVDASMFELPVPLVGGLTSNVPAMTTAAPNFSRFDPSTNAQKAVPTVDPTQDLGALGPVSVAANATAKVTVTFRVQGSPANPEGTRDARNVIMRTAN